ncbi:hypothetical protein GCM10009830_23140 [Glycomyces endophyticus]|uniref:VCBS repeat-containing protein n=1 Tax=Glycomyces endophyticus TaxID=480996 RepID=A0ABP4SQF1_9ACTN
MNRIPSRRTRALRRLAAATAAVVGTALLAAPGPASAQTVDCTTLGDLPTADGIANALETAITCGVEVRVKNRTYMSSTMYATPEAQLHLALTSTPELAPLSGTPSDRKLIESDGVLKQGTSGAVQLRSSNTEAPLIQVSSAELDWPGSTPVPTYEAASAHWEGLADGLDLTVDLGTADLGLRFGVADADAWASLASGLTAGGASWWTTSTAAGAIRWDADDYDSALWTTPFVVRDAAGAASPVELSLDESGALTMDLPGDVLENAAFPLDLSTQWGRTGPFIGEWGSISSAAPEQGIYRGEAGLDDPYFEAAGETGDAIAGGYCDAFATEPCSAQAASYWKFRWPLLQQISSSDGHFFQYQVESAQFTVDAAEGTECVAPDLDLTEPYTPAVTWNDRPSVVDAAASGTCADGTAVYDVSTALTSAWADPGHYDSVTFGTAATTDTARFDGGSGRLDVYIDTIGFYFLQINGSAYVCNLPYGRTADTTPVYGNFPLRTWRPDLVDSGLTWSVSITDAETGGIAFETEPVAATGDRVPTVSIDAANALADGGYDVQYEFASTTTGVVYRPTPCSFTVDTKAPEIVEVAVEPGPYLVGDSVSVEVTIADEGFPAEDGARVVVSCYSDETECSQSNVSLYDRTTASFELELKNSGSTDIWFDATDAVYNSGAGTKITLKPTTSRNDFDSDGYQDLVTVRRSDGALLLHAGDGDGGFAEAVTVASGWDAMTVAMAGDLTGDGIPDLLARDDRTGRLYTYPGDGQGGLAPRIQVGTGWNAINSFASGGDFDMDGDLDLLALRRAEGRVYLYPGLGDGTFGSRSVYGGDASFYGSDSLVVLEDVHGEGHAEFMVRNRGTGGYTVYLGGDGLEIGGRIDVDAALRGGDERDFSQVLPAGDLNGDGYGDFVAVDSRTGELVLRSWSEPAAASLIAAETIDQGWGGQDLPAGPADLTNGIGLVGTDLFARRSSDGTLFLYSGDGLGGFRAEGYGPTVVGTGWNGMNLVENAGDFNGDGFADLFAREASTGTLWLYQGAPGARFSSRLKIGGGWNAMSAIVAGHDYDGDGRYDILAREASTGNLWLYPGTGSGTHAARVLIGTGWGGMSLISAVGDLDHDGVNDIVARRNADNCLYFYAGKPAGGVEGGVKIGCGWDVMNTVASVGDFNGDGHVDWVARHTNGSLYLYAGNGKGAYSSSKVVGTGWGGMDLIV